MAVSIRCLCAAMWAVVLVLAVLDTRSEAMYIKGGQEETAFPQDDNSLQPQQPHQLSARSERTLFELLMSALKQPEQDYGVKRGKQFKATKPCYWSLVSCY